MDFSSEIQTKAIELAKLVLTMTSHPGSGHPSSALSLAHIVTVLMYRTMRFDYENPWSPANDRLVLSEGHAVPVVYAAYADLGGTYGADFAHRKHLTIDDLGSLRRIDSPLDGHPNPAAGFPFFDCATGSLGQGLSIACGIALAARADGIDKRIYVIIGDGESREGQVWEACDFLIDYHLRDVVPIFNCNGMGQSDRVSPQQSAARLVSKLEAFGFVPHTVDGHDPDAIHDALTAISRGDTPGAIVADTIKGWGVEELQCAGCHGKPLGKKSLDDAIGRLDKLKPPRGGPGALRTVELRPQAPAQVEPRQHRRGTTGDPDFEALLPSGATRDGFVQSRTLSTRRAYGLALRELARIDDRIVALDADVKNSTYAEYMAHETPERFFEARIAEQNMISVAAGLARNGKVPFVSSFAKFLIRGYDQLEIALISGAHVKLCGSHSGANVGADGPSQMGLTDLAFMRSLSTAADAQGAPLMVIFNPACAVCAYKCVQLMADLPSACYLRTIRTDLPVLYDPSERFEPGGAKLLREGGDVSILASGYMVHTGLRIADTLMSSGVHASVWDCYSFPMQPGIVAQAALSGNGKIMTLEDNYGNGLGAEVASIVARDPTITSVVNQMYVRRVPKSGLTADDVLAFVGLGS